MSDNISITEDLNLEIDNNLSNTDDAISEDDESPDDIIELPQGQALGIDETYGITAAKITKFIVLAGSAESGKTTLINSIYHIFQRRAFAGYMFAGSKTLVGFEQRCHPARILSNNSNAATNRTQRGFYNSILHLSLRDHLCQMEKQDLLITDFSGEDYDFVIANVESAKQEFDIIKRADNFVLLVDGNNISNKNYRNSTKQKSLQLLKTFLDGGLLDSTSRVDVLISKYDIVKIKCEDLKILSFLDDFKKDIELQFSKLFKQLRIYEIAARPNPETEEIGLGYGLEKLIPNWIESNPEYDHNEYVEYKSNSYSEFNMFAFRTVGQQSGYQK